MHTGVKSFGWEHRRPEKKKKYDEQQQRRRAASPQLSPSHSWKLILPCVVSAEKFGKGSASFAMLFRSGWCGESVAIARGKTMSRRIGLVESELAAIIGRPEGKAVAGM